MREINLHSKTDRSQFNLLHETFKKTGTSEGEKLKTKKNNILRSSSLVNSPEG